MNIEKVVHDLQKKYPEKNIILVPKENPTEIICEVDLEKGKTVIVLDRSQPHYHKIISEKYKILEGSLVIYIDGNEKELFCDDEFESYPGEVHFSIGKETWVECTSTPPLLKDDFYLETKNI